METAPSTHVINYLLFTSITRRPLGLLAASGSNLGGLWVCEPDEIVAKNCCDFYFGDKNWLDARLLVLLRHTKTCDASALARAAAVHEIEGRTPLGIPLD